MNLVTRLAAAMALALAGAGHVGSASAQIYLGGDVMLHDETGFPYWGDPGANAYWGGSSGDTLYDGSGWSSNHDIYNQQERHVVPDSYRDAGDSSGRRSLGSNTWDAPSKGYSFDFDYASGGFYWYLFDW